MREERREGADCEAGREIYREKERAGRAESKGESGRKAKLWVREGERGVRDRRRGGREGRQ